MKTPRFIDEVTVHAIAGDGGNGAVNFRREKYVPKGGPDGGDGGNGGSVILRGSNDENSLLGLFFNPRQAAKPGERGGRQQRHGANGADCIVPVPIGTEVHNAATNLLIGDITFHGQELIVAKGGHGGRGNVHWKSPSHQAPREHTDGEPGDTVTLRCNLKIMADVGMVGFPNAGKSSLLTCLSHAHPRIAAYPFTTLNPVVGTVVFEDYNRLLLADIPGLITGAHEGVGLGHAFLKHVERAAALAYVIDMAGTDGRDPVEDYRQLREELRLYQADLIRRPSLIIANKMDEPAAEENLKIFKRKTRTKPLPVSALSDEGLPELRTALHQFSHPPAS